VADIYAYRPEFGEKICRDALNSLSKLANHKTCSAKCTNNFIEIYACKGIDLKHTAAWRDFQKIKREFLKERFPARYKKRARKDLKGQRDAFADMGAMDFVQDH